MPLDAEAQTDASFAARKAQGDELDEAKAYFALHPEQMPKPTAPEPPAAAQPQPPASPAEADKEAQQVEGKGGAGSMQGGAIDDLVGQFVEKPVTELTGSEKAGKAAGWVAKLAPLAIGGGKAVLSDLGALGEGGEAASAAESGISAAEGGAQEGGAAAGPTAEAAPASPSATQVSRETGPGQFHGSKGHIDDLADYNYSPKNIYGQGFYTTDNPKVAQSYAKQGGQVYNVSENQPVKMLDLEKPPPEGVAEAINKSNPPVEMDPDQPMREWFDDMRHESGPETGLSADDVQEYFEHAKEVAQQEGYGGWQHIGGKLTGGQSHNVKVYFNPQSDISISASTIGSETPQSAAQSLAQKQIEALKTAKVGQSVAEEFGKPEIATQVSNEQTMADAAKFRDSMESVYHQPVEAPDLSAQTAALAKVYHAESNDMIDTATQLVGRMGAGEAIPPEEMEGLNNRFSAFAVQYARLAGARSEMGRGLQILDPLKPENVKASMVAQMAQQLALPQNKANLVEMLSRLPAEMVPRAARQMGDDMSLWGKLADGLHEYYIDNLLSDAGRTSSKIGVSNAISTLMQMPSRAVAARLPGSPVQPGEVMSQFEGFANGFWHSVDAFKESLMTGDRVAQMEDAADRSPYISKPAITGQNFGLEGTTLGTGIDYLGSALRLPQRGLTAVHQFSYSLAKTAEMHALAWRSALEQAQGDGSGWEGAQSLYHEAINAGFSPEIRQAADKAAGFTTFANAIEGKYPNLLQQLMQCPGLNLVVPFFRVAYNIKKMGLDMTPGIGAATGLATASTSADRYMVAGKQALACVIAGFAAHEVVKGHLTGDGPPPGPALDALKKEGWQPNSFKIGDRYVKVPEPLAFPLSVVANTVEQGQTMDAPTYTQKTMMVVRSMTRALANDSVVQGLVNLKKAASDAEENGFGPAAERFIGEIGKGFIPFSSLLGAVQRAQDPTSKDPQSVTDVMKAGLPDLPGGIAANYTASSVKPRYDIFHDAVPLMPGVPENLAYPVNVTKEHLDSVESAIVAANPSFHKVPQAIAGKKPGLLSDPNNPDLGVPLSPQEQDKWSEYRAQGLKEQFGRIISSPAYKNASQDMQKMLLENIETAQADVATAKLMADPSVMARYVGRIKARGMALTPHEINAAPPDTASSGAASMEGP